MSKQTTILPEFKFPDGHIIEIPFPNGFSGQQEKLLEDLYHWWKNRYSIEGPNIFLVKGFAGVGKTSVIKFFLQYLIEKNEIPKGFAISAPSHQARKQLFKSIKTMNVVNKFTKKSAPFITKDNAREFFKQKTFTTQAAFQTQLIMNNKGGMEYFQEKEIVSGYGKLLKAGIGAVSLWVIDEISMISDFYEIEKIKSYSTKIPVIIMGDPAQLRNPSTQRLSPLFSSSNVKHSVGLKEVMRTGKDNPLIEELTKLRNNIRSVTSPLSYETKIGPLGEGIVYKKDLSDLIKELYLSENYKENRSFVKVVAKSNDKVASYNKSIRGILGFEEGGFAYGKGDTLMGYAQPIEIFYNSQEYIVDSIVAEPIGLLKMLSTTLRNGQKVGLDDFTLGSLQNGIAKIKNVLMHLGIPDIELIPYTLEVTESDSIFIPAKMVMYIFDMKDQQHIDEFDKTAPLFNFIYDKVESLKVEEKKAAPEKRKDFWKEHIMPIENALKVLSATLQTNENIYRYKGQIICESVIEKNVKAKLAEKGLSYEKVREYVEMTKKKTSLFKEKSIDYGYAITAYKSQGATYENTIVDLDNIEGRNHYWREHLKNNPSGIENLNSEIYVAMSRSSKNTYALTQYAK